MDGAATVLARWRLPEGVAGIAQLHQLIGGLLGEDAGDSEVRVGIETDHGPRAMAVIAAGCQVFPVNPQQSAWFRARHQVPGAKSEMPGTRRCARTLVRACFRQRELPTWSGHAGDDRGALIDTRDVADVVAAILAEGPGIAGTVGAKVPFPSEASWWRAAGPQAARGWHAA